MTSPYPDSLHRSYAGLLPHALLMAALCSHPAAAQSPNFAPSGDIMKPRGQREVTDVTFRQWTKLCFNPGGAKTLCRTSITGTFPTGQMAVRLDLIEREGDTVKRMQVFSPVGMYLPNQVELIIDRGEPYRLPYTWCMANACIAGAIASPSLISELQTGRILQLRFTDSSLLLLTTSVPLVSFVTTYGGPPAQTYRQDIDE